MLDDKVVTVSSREGLQRKIASGREFCDDFLLDRRQALVILLHACHTKYQVSHDPRFDALLLSKNR